jgi:glycosyltransferase involved in cell wall biosynthesis
LVEPPRLLIATDKNVISVIIPTYNQIDSLLDCLRALAEQEGEPSSYEVIVTDMGSTDGTGERLEGFHYQYSLRVIAVGSGGACRARNEGAGVARGDWLAFTGDDVLPERDWLRLAQEHIDFHPELDLLEGTVVDKDSGESMRRFEGGRIPSFPPLNLFVKKSVFDRLGGFDPSFDDAKRHTHFRGDAEFGMRLLDIGGKVALASNVAVRRARPFTSAGDLFRQMRLHEFDALLYRSHPFRFRQLIEVKSLFGLPVRRLQHIISLAYGTAMVWCLVTAAEGRFYEAYSALLAACACGLLFRYKYQGLRALQIYRIKETAGFLLAPVIYLWSVLQGAIRYRAPGVLLP